MSLPIIREHTAAVIAALQGFGLSVGDAQAPAGVSEKYAVVFPIAGGDSYGTLAARNDDAELIYQVTCVGETREQAEWVADKAMGLLAGFAVSGRSVPVVALESMPGIQRDDAKSPPLYYATPRFRVFSTPS